MEENNTPPKTPTGKVLGIPSHKYAQLCYMLILISPAFELVSSLLLLVGMYIGVGGIMSLIGLIGLAMAVTGWLVFSEEFGEIDLSHFKALSLLFVIFFVFNIIFFNATASFGIISPILQFLITAFEVAVLFAAFDVWRARQKATVESIKASFFGLKKYLPGQ